MTYTGLSEVEQGVETRRSKTASGEHGTWAAPHLGVCAYENGRLDQWHPLPLLVSFSLRIYSSC